jgi:hypothetical protein
MPEIDTYSVTWHEPGRNADDSMPLGNGDIGLNAWAESNGDLVFYIGKTDSWDDYGRLLKVGRIRVSLDPTPSGPFLQTLTVKDATMEIRWGETRLRLWVDANHPVIELEVDSPDSVTATATIELWRTEREKLSSITTSDVWAGAGFDGTNEDQGETIVEPDTLIAETDDRIGWVHHNVKSVGPEMHARIQGLDGFEREDPLLHRTFGAVVWADGGRRLGGARLESPAAPRHWIRIAVLTRHPSTPDAWKADIEEAIETATAKSPKARRSEHEAWWRSFWDRSWIHVSGGGGTEAAEVSRAYALQRFVQACAGRGAYPIKFNGSIFNVPFEDQPGDADWRRWGPGYWWQNTRLPYYAMCPAGDFECMEPLFRMYCRDLHALNRYRTKAYVGHEGIFIPETIYFWGDTVGNAYGWTPWEEREEKLQPAGWHKYEWTGSLELAWLLLEYYAHTGDDDLLQDTLLPFANDALRFFDLQYPSEPGETMTMEPSQACETWWDCTNPMPEIAGLYAVIGRLLALPLDRTSEEDRTYWSALLEKLPPVPTRSVDGVTMLAPAARFENKMNEEHPELYGVFPFRLYGVGKPDIEKAIEALHNRDDANNVGWHQDEAFMAYLGLADEARENLLVRIRSRKGESFVDGRDAQTPMKFPAFWGPNFDWTPDQCHGGMIMIVIQSMLLQRDGDRVLLFPAWPKDWDVEFRLRAPHGTVLAGTYRDRKLVELKVTPESRRADVVVCLEESRQR